MQFDVWTVSIKVCEFGMERGITRGCDSINVPRAPENWNGTSLMDLA